MLILLNKKLQNIINVFIFQSLHYKVCKKIEFLTYKLYKDTY